MATPSPALSEEVLRPFLFFEKDQLFAQFRLKNVKCGHCQYKIEKCLQSQSGILKYDFKASGNLLSIAAQNIGDILSAAKKIDSMGFGIRPIPIIESKNVEKDEFKKNLKRLAVAAVGAGNIMLFSTAIYFGAPAGFKTFFSWMSFILAVPVLMYSAQPIWDGCITGLKKRAFNLDIPIGIAIAFGSLFSLMNLLRGSDAVYFDSIAIVLFLVLSSRFFLNAYLAKIYDDANCDFIPGAVFARVVEKGVSRIVNPMQLKKNQMVRVHKGETCPADGLLQSQHGVLDYSIVSGESEPIILKKGEAVLAGSRLCAGSIDVQTTSVGHNTRIGSIVGTALESFQKVREERMHWIATFTFLVVSLSVCTFFYFAIQGQWESAFQRAFAMIIIACPCAISFGLPLVRLFSSHLSFKKGILVKNPKSLSALNTIEHVCFDKTGTLTESVVRVSKRDLEAFDNADLQAIFALENQVDHPIARGVLAHRNPEDGLPLVSQFEYIPRQGVKGYVIGNLYEIYGREDGDQKFAEVYKEGVSIGRVGLYPEVRKTAAPLFDFLENREMKISLLSGDHFEQVNAVWKNLPVKSRGVFVAEATPEMKEEYIDSIDGQCLMVGDGINDVSAMKKSKVSIALPGALEHNMKLSDISLLNGNLGLIKEIFLIAKRVRNTENSLFRFTAMYNTCCILLAMAGFVSPVVAAILMPISSATVLSIVYSQLGRPMWK